MGVGKSKKLATSFAIFVTLLFSLMAGVVAHAQVTGATLSGTVTDSSGGVVANATVSATNTPLRLPETLRPILPVSTTSPT